MRGVAKQNEAIVEFSVRQMLDVLAPSNFAATNPEVLQKAFESGGENFVRGWQNWCSDWMRLLSGGRRPVGRHDFVVGENVATSPGKVVFRNELIELIQYYPTTEQGPSGADPDRAGLDHEVLHPRSVAAELAGEVSHRSRVSPCS